MIAAAIVFLVFCAVTDVFYVARIFFSAGKFTFRHLLGYTSRTPLTAEIELKSIVLPADIDVIGHMNNSRYLREFDFGRMAWIHGTGIALGMFPSRSIPCPILSAVSVRFRRSLHLFQVFVMKTRMLSWDDCSFFVEQRIVDGSGFVCTVMLCKMTFPGVAPQAIVDKIEGKTVTRPALPPEVSSWIESISHSSAKLRQEAKLEIKKQT
jgi:acyl-CoA thioesterase FadM